MPLPLRGYDNDDDDLNTTIPTYLLNLSRKSHSSLHVHVHVHGDSLFQWKSDAIFFCALSTVVGLTTSMYQAKGQDPFEAYPVSNGLSILALLVCFCASLVLKKYHQLTLKTERTWAKVCVSSATMALVVLTSVPLHNKLGWPAYPLCGFPLVLLMVKPLKQKLKWIKWKAVEAMLAALDMLGRLLKPSGIDLQYQLPV